MQPKTALPKTDDVRQLPVDLSMVIPPDWEDRNGHVNVQHYLSLYERGGWQIVHRIGIDEHYLVETRKSFFDLEHHIRYLSEINVGDTVSVYNRLLSYNHKLFQGMFFIVNDTQNNLAATIEYLSLHIDLEQRSSVPFSTEIRARLNELHHQHQSLNWAPPMCNLMNL